MKKHESVINKNLVLFMERGDKYGINERTTDRNT